MSPPTPEHWLSEMLEKMRLVHEHQLNELISSCDVDGIQISPILQKGDPRSQIIELVEKRKIDLLVMGTASRSGLPGLLIGNTAEKILNQLGCSVLAVKPDGFVSPVS